MRCLKLVVLAASITVAQEKPLNEREPLRLPDGKLQTDAIVKADHEQSLKDARELKKLIDSFVDDMEKSDRNVVSLPIVKKLDEIEKRVKKIRSRMTRY